MKLLILNKHEVERLLPMQECIDLMAEALVSLARGQVILPLRPVIRIPDSPNVFGLMPADAKTAVTAADVVCTVTASREPVLRGKWLRQGAHINAVGASLPTTRELDTEAVKRADVYVDRRESALNEAGDLLIPIGEGAIS